MACVTLFHAPGSPRRHVATEGRLHATSRIPEGRDADGRSLGSGAGPVRLLSGRPEAGQPPGKLARLKTDRIDLLQHHEIIRLEDPDRIFAEGGAQEAVLAARKAGKVRFVGFTGHKDPLVHLRMLDVAAKHGFAFDTAQMPLNVMDAHFRSFDKQVLPVLVKEGIGVLGMKSMGDGIILKSKTVTPVECLHYAMNLPTSTVI